MHSPSRLSRPATVPASRIFASTAHHRGGRQPPQEEDRRCPRSHASRCSASSTASPTRRSRARPSSARCAATPTSSWCTGSHQILQLQDSDLHRIVRALRARCRRGWPRDMTDGARPAAARRDVDLRSLDARRGRGRARLGLRHADVRRRRRCAPATWWSASLKTPALRNALLRDLARVRARSSVDDLTERLRRDRRRLARETRCAPATAPGRRRRAPGEASGAMAPAAHGQAGGAASSSRSTSPSARARARSIRSSGATRRSARSSTS